MNLLVETYRRQVESKENEEYPKWDLSVRPLVPVLCGPQPLVCPSSVPNTTPVLVCCEQQPLPKLPVPELRKTLAAYVSCVEAVEAPADVERVRALADRFAGGSISDDAKGDDGPEAEAEGARLQRLLEARAAREENWAYRLWLEEMYLVVREPLPVWSNPGLVFPTQRFLADEQQLSFAARLVAGVLDYKAIIDVYASSASSFFSPRTLHSQPPPLSLLSSIRSLSHRNRFLSVFKRCGGECLLIRGPHGCIRIHSGA